MVSQQEPGVTKKEIESRVQDWQQRLIVLYSDIQKWLPAEMGYEIDTSGTTVMNEELMKQKGVPPVNLPTLKIFKDKEVLLFFQPKGLWVIGANGRVDVFGKVNNWILVDTSERFAAATDWRIADPSDRVSLKSFNRDALVKMLSEN